MKGSIPEHLLAIADAQVALELAAIRPQTPCRICEPGRPCWAHASHEMRTARATLAASER